MDIQGSNLAYALDVKTAQMSNNQQKQEGQAVLQLLESAVIAPVGSSGYNINTYA
ncbi:hypothetical protein [Glaciecola sp. 1036]|uniref:hypothetical protein n=1 Tax=Alteromonadaceae TaxID=72275 RepID=UPI003D00F051